VVLFGMNFNNRSLLNKINCSKRRQVNVWWSILKHRKTFLIKCPKIKSTRSWWWSSCIKIILILKKTLRTLEMMNGLSITMIYRLEKIFKIPINRNFSRALRRKVLIERLLKMSFIRLRRKDNSMMHKPNWNS